MNKAVCESVIIISGEQVASVISVTIFRQPVSTYKTPKIDIDINIDIETLFNVEYDEH